MQVIKVSDAVYRRLQHQAERLRMTPEQVIEQMSAQDTTRGPADVEVDVDFPLAGSAEALAAVKRLTTLFAAPPLPNIDAVLADPLLTLANADLDDLSR